MKLAVLITLLTLSNSRPLRERSYAEMTAEWKRLEREYPQYVHLTTAQDRWGLASPGSCGPSGPCVQLIARVTEEATLLTDAARAEVFLSGALHGDERIGPNAVTELTGWILEQRAAGNEWATLLLRKRALYVMPMTNSWGYHHDRRTENGVDTNRDFPYFQKPAKCMVSITARALNELFREHVFQLAITFHGGMDAIVYEWGDTEHIGTKMTSPDDAGQHALAFAMRDYAGTFENTMFPAGPINSIVYPVNGGMEDWAYAGSWGSGKGACTPSSFGGYPAERTAYDATNSLRLLNILIEAGPKHPPHAKYGSTDELLRASGVGDGHIARSVRMSLMVLDAVEPYVVWVAPPASLACAAGEQPVAWEVGGAFTVDATQVLSGAWGSRTLCAYAVEDAVAPTLRGCDLGSEATLAAGGAHIAVAGVPLAAIDRTTAVQSGAKSTRWTASGWAQRDMGAAPFFLPRFTACVPLPADGSAVFAVVRARVDQGWGKKLKTPVYPNIAPQSHYVNARTNLNWAATVSTPAKGNAPAEVHRIVGRLDWLSNARRFGSVAAAAKLSPSPLPALRATRSRAAEPSFGTARAASPPRDDGMSPLVAVKPFRVLPTLLAVCVVLGLGALCFFSLRRRVQRKVGGRRSSGGGGGGDRSERRSNFKAVPKSEAEDETLPINVR